MTGPDRGAHAADLHDDLPPAPQGPPAVDYDVRPSSSASDETDASAFDHPPAVSAPAGSIEEAIAQVQAALDEDDGTVGAMAKAGEALRVVTARAEVQTEELAALRARVEGADAACLAYEEKVRSGELVHRDAARWDAEALEQQHIALRGAAQRILQVQTGRDPGEVKTSTLVAEINVLADIPRQIVCAVALVTDPADRILLVRHRKRGTWELPGGKKGPAETWRDATRREAFEEAGLEIALAQGGPYDVLDGLPVPGAPYASTILVALARAEGTPTPGDDAAEARWFERGEIPWADLSKIGSAEVVKRWAEESASEVERAWKEWFRSVGGEDALREDIERRAAATAEPTPMLLWCPNCHTRHVDKGRFATHRHHTHACQSCGLAWRPAVSATVGVDFLPGFKDAPEVSFADACTVPVVASGSEDREWEFKLDGVRVERTDVAAGWAVFSGSEGEDPTLRAFFPGRSGHSLATLLLEAKDPEEDEPVIFDGSMVPALLVSGLHTDGGLFIANDFDNRKAIAAMARAWGRAEEDWHPIDVSERTWLTPAEAVARQS